MNIKQPLLIFVLAFFYISPAYAYLDPGTGSIILQLLIAAIVGALFTLKLYWYRFKAFIKRLFSRKREATQDTTEK
jgi:O-antigen/teichoic acid export membrane protein